jgi:hypothetical protein
MQARWVAVEAVHVVAHAALRVYAQAAPDGGRELLWAAQLLDPSTHVRERTALS